MRATRNMPLLMVFMAFSHICTSKSFGCLAFFPRAPKMDHRTEYFLAMYLSIRLEVLVRPLCLMWTPMSTSFQTGMWPNLASLCYGWRFHISWETSWLADWFIEPGFSGELSVILIWVGYTCYICLAVKVHVQTGLQHKMGISTFG